MQFSLLDFHRNSHTLRIVSFTILTFAIHHSFALPSSSPLICSSLQLTTRLLFPPAHNSFALPSSSKLVSSTNHSHYCSALNQWIDFTDNLFKRLTLIVFDSLFFIIFSFRFLVFCITQQCWSLRGHVLDLKPPQGQYGMSLASGVTVGLDIDKIIVGSVVHAAELNWKWIFSFYTRSVLWPRICRQYVFSRSLVPDLTGVTYDALPNCLVGWERTPIPNPHPTKEKGRNL